MHTTKAQAVSDNWDGVESYNYKLKHLSPYQSVVHAAIKGEHGEETTEDVEVIYYIISGQGRFIFNNQKVEVEPGDVLTIPPHTTYNYFSNADTTLEIVLFCELWDN